MDATWTDDKQRDGVDYVALGIIAIMLVMCGLLCLGARVAPFIVSRAYGELNWPVALFTALIGGLIGLYLLATWVPAASVRTAIATVLLPAGMGFITVHTGLPATLASLTGVKQTVVFQITDTTSYGGRRSCAGVYIEHPDYERTKICRSPQKGGAHLAVTGQQSWYGLFYSDTELRL